MLNNFLSAEGGLFDDAVVIIVIVALVLLVGAMIIMPMFTSKKRNSQTNALYSNLSPGDKVMTIGGIIGTILEIAERSPADKELLIETGAEGSKTTLWIDLKGVYQNLSKPAAETNFFGKPKEPIPAIPTAVNKEPEAAVDEPFSDVNVPKEE